MMFNVNLFFIIPFKTKSIVNKIIIEKNKISVITSFIELKLYSKISDNNPMIIINITILNTEILFFINSITFMN